MPEIIDRKMAIALGMKRYFTGKPCCRGHVAERIVSSSFCLDCDRENRALHRVSQREYQRRWYLANAEKIKERSVSRIEYQRRWYLANAEKIKELSHTRYLNNPQKHAERDRRWRQNNPEKNKALRRKANLKRYLKVKIALKTLETLGVKL